MGQVVWLEAHRRRRLAGGEGSPGRVADPFGRLELAVRRLDEALHLAADDTVEELEVASELRAVTGAVTGRRYLDAATRAERLLARLRRTS